MHGCLVRLRISGVSGANCTAAGTGCAAGSRAWAEGGGRDLGGGTWVPPCPVPAPGPGKQPPHMVAQQVTLEKSFSAGTRDFWGWGELAATLLVLVLGHTSRAVVAHVCSEVVPLGAVPRATRSGRAALGHRTSLVPWCGLCAWPGWGWQSEKAMQHGDNPQAARRDPDAPRWAAQRGPASGRGSWRCQLRSIPSRLIPGCSRHFHLTKCWSRHGNRHGGGTITRRNRAGSSGLRRAGSGLPAPCCLCQISAGCRMLLGACSAPACAVVFLELQQGPIHQGLPSPERALKDAQKNPTQQQQQQKETKWKAL